MHVVAAKINDFCAAMALGHTQTAIELVDGNDALCPHQIRTLNCHLAHCTATPNSNNVPGLNTCQLSCDVTRRDSVRDEHCLIVAYIVGNLEDVRVCKGYADKLGMTTCVPSEGMAVPKYSRAGMAVGSFREGGFRVGVVATGEFLTLAVLTVSAGENGRDHDAVSGAQPLYGTAHFHDFSHEFVAQDIAWLHPRYIPADQVEIRAAYG